MLPHQPYHLLPAQSAPQFNIVLIHGMLEHSARYHAFAQFLAQNGGNVVYFDLPGHGAGNIHTDRLNDFGTQGLQSVFDHIHAIFQYWDNDLPNVLFGHSMGSAIALRYAQLHHDISLLLLSGIPAKSARLFNLAYHVSLIEKRIKGADKPSMLLKEAERFNQHFAPNRTAFDWLSRNDRNVDAYIADPLCGYAIGVAYLEEMLNVMRMAFHRDELLKMNHQLPIAMFWGEDDPCTNFGRAPNRLANFLRPHWQAPITSTHYSQMRHEILHEQDHAKVFQDILRHIQPNPIANNPAP